MMDLNDMKKHISAVARQEWAGIGSQDSSTDTPAPQSEMSARLNQLLAECQTCQRCPLFKTANHLVFGEGNPDNRIVVIGEAPGADEDRQGKPFVGRSGKLLRKTFEELGIPACEVFICNILKHRPPENRNPELSEIQACTPWLEQQLAIIRPQIIITLGNYSTQYILKTKIGITKLRGQIHDSPFGYKIFPTFHPSAILRNVNNLPFFREDLQGAVDYAKKMNESEK